MLGGHEGGSPGAVALGATYTLSWAGEHPYAISGEGLILLPTLPGGTLGAGSGPQHPRSRLSKVKGWWAARQSLR